MYIKDVQEKEEPNILTSEFFEAASQYFSSRSTYLRHKEQGTLTDEDIRLGGENREAQKILWNYIGGLEHACQKGFSPWDFLDYNLPREEAKKLIEYKKTAQDIKKWEERKDNSVYPQVFLFCPMIITMLDSFSAINILLSLLFLPGFLFCSHCIDLLFGRIYDNMLLKYSTARL